MQGRREHKCGGVPDQNKSGAGEAVTFRHEDVHQPQRRARTAWEQAVAAALFPGLFF